MALLERDTELTEISDLLRMAAEAEVHRPRSSVVLVAGEAGMGKSALLRAAAATAQEIGADVWWGACDALSTPRTLGPFVDIAEVEGVGELIVAGNLYVRLAGLLRRLRERDKPLLLVIEDAHWADAATRDALTYLGRRINDTRAVLAVSFRDDEVDPQHPLRPVLGQLVAQGATRLELSGLSPQAVGALVGERRDAAAVHRVTKGNPFYVTELAATDGDLPATVADAVLARAFDLPPQSRAALDVASLLPDGAELDLVRDVASADSAAIDRLLHRGLLVGGAGGRLMFRHEIARLAIRDAVPGGIAQELHGRILGWLRRRPTADPARVMHHAVAAGDEAAVRDFAPVAAAKASAAGSHREAAKHWETLLAQVPDLEPRRRAETLQALADELATWAGDVRTAEVRRQALAVWEEVGDRAKIGTLRGLIALRRNSADGLADAEAAVAYCEANATGAPLALARAALAFDHMLARRNREAVEIAEQAVAEAEMIGDASALGMALNALGSAMFFIDPDRALGPLTRSYEIGVSAGDDHIAARAMLNIGSAAGEARAYAIAVPWLDRMIAWSTDRDLDQSRDYCLAWKARIRLEQGRWSEADTLLERLSATDDLISRIVATTVLARLRVRRGDPLGTALEDAGRLAEQVGHLQRTWPAAAARAEWLWVHGREREIPAVVEPAFAAAKEVGFDWPIGELGGWLVRVGELSTEDLRMALAAVPGTADPYRRQFAGDTSGALAAWELLGCPFEAAMTKLDSDDNALRAEAVGELRRLGARAFADAAARRLRIDGVTHIPRGVRPRTLNDPDGLTVREGEVLALLAEGRTNAEIASRLHLSVKTAGHHVSAILAKLGARTRTEAAAIARERAGAS
ncbi:ATP-binding protein [Propionicimonas sp.]|uniref:ATP-binding protein n=1 Tax=Propionicimonas sp. TaxID=1955623 RepID=UPI0039E21A4C